MLPATTEVQGSHWRRKAVFAGIAITAVLPMGLSGCPCSCSPVPPYRPYLPQSIAIADFNSDGVEDLAVGSFRYYENSAQSDKVVSIVLQARNAVGTFQSGIDSFVSVSPSAVATADLNGDGRADIVVAGADSSDIAILLQSSAPSSPLLAPYVVPTGKASENSRFADVAIGDLNSDGAMDIAVADGRSSGQVVVLFQNPLSAGQFLSPTLLSVGGLATAVAVADIDNDGITDLVVTSNNQVGRVSVLLNSAAAPGQFLPRADIAVAGEPRSVAVGDLNGDGRLDIAIASARQGIVVLMQNTAQRGTFLAPLGYATKGSAADVAIGDLDGDGRLDLAVADGSLQGVAVFLQDAATAGVLQSPINYTDFFIPDSAAIGDLNNDGLPDIAVGDGNRAKVLFNRSTAPGTFAAPVQVGS